MSARRCPACEAKLERSAAYCAACGRAVGPAIELDELGDNGPAEGEDIELLRVGGRRRTIAIVAGGAVLVAAIAAFATGGSNGRSTSPTSTLSPSAVTTTEPVAPPVPTIIGDGRPLLGLPSGLAVIASTGDGELHRLDLDTGQLDVTRFSSSPTDSPETWFLTSAGLIYTDGKGLVLRTPAGTERKIALTGPSSYNPIGSADANSFWVQSQPQAQAIGQPTPATMMFRVDLRTSAVVETTGPINAYPSGIDSDGRPLFGLADGTIWKLDAEHRWVKLGGSSTQALGHGLYLEAACPSPPTCSMVARKADGTVVASLPTTSSYPGQDLQGSASNGDLIALVRASLDGVGASTIEVYNLAGTLVATLDDFMIRYHMGRGLGGLTWSADGQWLIWAGGYKLHAWRPGFAHAITIDLPTSTSLIDDMVVTSSH